MRRHGIFWGLCVIGALKINRIRYPCGIKQKLSEFVLFVLSAFSAFKSWLNWRRLYDRIMVSEGLFRSMSEEIAELEAAEKMPIVFDDDCPEMTGEMLNQFHRMNTITIGISPGNMKKVKALGADYPKILSSLLDLALNDTDLLKKCM